MIVRMRDRSSSGWLSTREAAVRLRASEASVRRWADGGKLPVRRVGKRGDRRFRAADVDRLAAGGRRAGADSREERATVLVAGHPVTAGTHLTVMYDSDSSRVRISAPFLAGGLLGGQQCFLFARGQELESHLQSLRRFHGVDVDQALASGTLVVDDAPGRTVSEALEFWENALWSALGSKATMVRGVGEVASERQRFVSERELLSYETMLNLTVKRFPCVVLCQYDVRKFSGQVILDALRAHPDLLATPLRLLLP